MPDEVQGRVVTPAYPLAQMPVAEANAFVAGHTTLLAASLTCAQTLRVQPGETAPQVPDAEHVACGVPE